MKAFIDKLPRRFQFTIHNVLAHPLFELFYQLGFHSIATFIHESTCPSDPDQTLSEGDSDHEEK